MHTCTAAHAACAALAKIGSRHWSGLGPCLKSSPWERGSIGTASAVRYSGCSNMAAKDSLQCMQRTSTFPFPDATSSMYEIVQQNKWYHKHGGGLLATTRISHRAAQSLSLPPKAGCNATILKNSGQLQRECIA